VSALETFVNVGAWVAAVLVLGLITLHGLTNSKAQQFPNTNCPEFLDLERAQHDPAYLAMSNAMSPACKALRNAHQGHVVIGPGSAK